MICDTIKSVKIMADTTSRKEEKKRKKKEIIVDPGEIRANRGLIFLKDQYIAVFR